MFFLNYFAVYMDVLNWITYWKPKLFEKKCQSAPPRIIAFAPLLFLFTNLFLRPWTNVTTRGQKPPHCCSLRVKYDEQKYTFT